MMLTNKENIIKFRKSLIDWGKDNFRQYPWRNTSDPYKILIAELMLHRTQARQVVNTYHKFIRLYPDIKSLGQIKEDDIEKILFSLGLTWRAKLVYVTAKEIILRFNEEIPKNKNDLMSLPGVGDYIASSIRCFAWNIPEPLVDTNTIRVVGRLYNLKTKDSSRRNEQFRKLIEMLVDPEKPRLYNFAILDLADSICSSKLPNHKSCPVFEFCLYEKK